MTTAQSANRQHARRAPVRKPASTGKLQSELNPRQYDFVFMPARFSFYVGGVGAGGVSVGWAWRRSSIVIEPSRFGVINRAEKGFLDPLAVPTIKDLLQGVRTADG